MRNEQIAVVIYGFPGSGKGTQANLAANAFGLVNFDTGRYLERLWYDPKRQRDPVVRREKQLFESGKLNTPSFVLNEVTKAVKAIAKKDLGVVFSGSPRTMYEAERLIPTLMRLFGKKRVFFFFLNVPPEVAIERNSKRRLCTFCKTPLLARYYPSKNPKYCPVCAGALYKRTLDNVDVIPKRIAEYNERTAPILGYLKEHGYDIARIDGRTKPFEVFRHIASRIEAGLK